MTDIEQSLRKQHVATLQYATPAPLPTTTAMSEVIEAMRRDSLGCALLVEGEKLAGIITERDVMLQVIGDPTALARPAAEFMTPNPIAVDDTADIARAIFHMHQGGFRSVPVVDAEGRPKGYIRHHDIIRYLVEHFAGHVMNLPPEEDRISVAREGG